jgi:hypothetical protein
LRVAAPAGWVTRAFFALADNHGVVLRGLQRDDEDLEELFHRVIAQDETSVVRRPLSVAKTQDNVQATDNGQRTTDH